MHTRVLKWTEDSRNATWIVWVAYRKQESPQGLSRRPENYITAEVKNVYDPRRKKEGWPLEGSLVEKHQSLGIMQSIVKKSRKRVTSQEKNI